MCRRFLDELTSDSFVLPLLLLSTPGALRRQLLRSNEVRKVHEAIRQGAITEETLREFVSSLLVTFHVGERFEHELTLAALAVLLENRPTKFAEEFLLDLAKLKLAEMPLCIRVARECLKQRITHNKVKEFRPWTWPCGLSLQQLKPRQPGSLDSVRTASKLIDMRPTNAKT